MRLETKYKSALSALLFTVPYIIVELTNLILLTIDKSLSNSIGVTAIIVFASIMSLDSAINIIQECISQSHSIVLSRDKKNSKSINSAAIFLQIISSIIISLIILTFANKLTYIYTLEDDARDILTYLIKLKAIQLPILGISYIFKNDVKIKEKTNLILISTVISSIINIAGDLISIRLGYNEIGIYLSTIISTIVNTIFLFYFSKFKYCKIEVKFIKDIVNHAKDLFLNKTIQKFAFIFLESISSTFGTDVYVIVCICSAIVEVLLQLAEGYYTGLLVYYANEIEIKTKNLLSNVNKVTILSLFFSLIFYIAIPYPAWYFLGRSIPWSRCFVYVYLYATEFFTYIINNNYLAYLSANKDTKAIKFTSFIGGICIRVPLLCLIKYFNIGLVGLALVCTFDRLVRTIYLKCYIKNNDKLYK